MEQASLSASLSGSRSEDDLTRFNLNSVSVVILAQTHNPSIINADFLRNNGIIKEDWEINHQLPILTSQGLALVSFKNGVQWQIDPNNLTILEGIRDGFFKETYSAYDCAKEYVHVLKHIPYKAFGMNWQLISEEKDSDWMNNHFLQRDKERNDMKLSSITFEIPPSWKITLSSSEAESKARFILDCNYHTNILPGGDRVEVINLTLNELHSHQDNLKRIIKSHFGGSFL